MDAKKEPSALDTAGGRLLGHLAASQPAAEADLKALEAHAGDKVEVSAKQLHAAAQAFQKALEESCEGRGGASAVGRAVAGRHRTCQGPRSRI